MGIYALTSVSGSPGVTTTAVAWATCASTPTLLVEADMTGGSPILAGRFRSEIPHHKTILAMATRDAGITAAEMLQDQSIPLPGAVSASRVIPTIAEHSQSRALLSAWPQTATALRHLADDGGMDVLIDLGRITTQGSAWGLLEGVDAVIVMAHTTLPSLIGLANGLPRVADQLARPFLGVAFVQAQLEGFPVRDAAQVMAPVPVVGSLPHNRQGAAAYSLGWAGASTRTLKTYHRTIGQFGSDVVAKVAEHRQVLMGDRP